MLKKIYKAFESFEEWAIVFTLISMTTIAFVNVISRKFLELSLSFTEELTVNLLVWVVFLGGSVAAKRGAHLGLTMLTDMFPTKFRKIVELIVMAIEVVFFAAMCYYSFFTISGQMRLGMTTPSLGWPQWVMSISLPVGSFLLSFRFLEAGIKNFLKKEENN